MKLKRMNLVATALSCVGMLLSPVAMAAEPLPAPIRTTPSDVALGDGGVLVGQVVDAQGVALAMETVTLADHQQEIARVRADQDGRFSVPDLKGGVYRIAARGQESMYRLWAPNTAPPAAQQRVMFVVGDQVVRGQYGVTPGPFSSMAQWVADHPLITGSAIAAAIAIPIALDDDDPPASP